MSRFVLTLILPLLLLCGRLAYAAELMVVAAHPLASDAGLKVLLDGGSAADAALATAFVLNVVEPHASGLGGGGFALLVDERGMGEVIDYRECAPQKVDPARYTDPADTLKLAQQTGGPSVAVPGTAAGLHQLWLRHGRLSLGRLLQPAIELAREGYPVSEALATQIQEKLDRFMAVPEQGALFLKDGFPPAAGDTLRNEPLAQVLEGLAARGLPSFYASQGEAIARVVQEDGGWIDEADLAGYKALRREPLMGSYRGLDFLAVPPPATGAIAVLECLNILEAVPLDRVTESQRLHLLAEAHKKAWRDRGKRLGDPAFCEMPIDSLLDKDYARAQLEHIHPDALHHNWPPLGSLSWEEKLEEFPPRDDGNTTHISILDGDGAMLSLTQSINYFFGSGLAVNGYFLNNTAADFTFIEESLNWPEPGKRPRSSMAPMVALQDGRPVLALGTPGGPRIVTAMEQILVHHIDLGMGIQEAIDAPRFHPLGSTFVHETRFAAETGPELEKIGYRPYPHGEFNNYFGGAHAISRLHGRLEGGADPRRGGQVAVFVMP